MSHAIVIGASIAGLAAAHVLSQSFEKVTIVDRDQLIETPDFRKGVPQGRHGHIILRRGLDIMESYFPGLKQELINAQAFTMNFGAARFFMFGGTRPVYNSKVETISCSRPLLETTIYRRLRQNPRIEIIDNTDVVTVCVDDSGTKATGLQLQHRQRSGREEFSTLTADLILDASGRDSHAAEWLTQLGFTAPTETVVSSDSAYASRIYAMPTDRQLAFNTLVVQPTAPAGKRGAVLLPMEGNRYHVILIGTAGDYPPTDEAGFQAFIASLPTSLLTEALQGAEPLSPIYGYRRTENRMRAYDQLPRYLEHFLIMGDSVCSFNPMYGQGMTVACMESIALAEAVGDHLKTHPEGDFRGLAADFQKRVAKVVAMPWQLASGEDRRWNPNEKPDFATRVMQWYVEHVLRASLHSTAVAEAFYQVQNMLAEPTLLFRPDVVFNVFKTRLTTS